LIERSGNEKFLQREDQVMIINLGTAEERGPDCIAIIGRALDQGRERIAVIV